MIKILLKQLKHSDAAIAQELMNELTQKLARTNEKV